MSQISTQNDDNTRQIRINYLQKYKNNLSVTNYNILSRALTIN